MSEKATLRLRFVLNHQSGRADDKGARQKAGQQFATAIVRELGLNVANEKFEDIKSRIQTEIARDVRDEIQHLAKMYRRFIIGAAQLRSSRGELTAVHTAKNESLQNLGHAKWKPLNAAYVRRKGHARFFENEGFLASGIGKGDLWMQSFGPISVKVIRLKSNTEVTPGFFPSDPQEPKFLLKDGSKQFAVCRIEVTALGRITPQMLPSLSRGDLNAPITADGRRTGLLGMVAAAGHPEIAVRLGGGPSDSSHPYRPSLEPFLTFGLTRSIPGAVFKRIQRGIGRV